jgi:uncharacterized membrane protein YkoI
MTLRMALAALLIATAAPLFAPVAAFAQDGRPALGAGRDDQDQARAGVRSGRQIPLTRVIATIAARTPGQQINTTMGEQGGRPAYFVQWRKNNGSVVVFVVDAETGAMLGQQGG